MNKATNYSGHPVYNQPNQVFPPFLFVLFFHSQENSFLSHYLASGGHTVHQEG